MLSQQLMGLEALLLRLLARKRHEIPSHGLVLLVEAEAPHHRGASNR